MDTKTTTAVLNILTIIVGVLSIFISGYCLGRYHGLKQAQRMFDKFVKEITR